MMPAGGEEESQSADPTATIRSWASATWEHVTGIRLSQDEKLDRFLKGLLHFIYNRGVNHNNFEQLTYRSGLTKFK
jgi:hypothetical protein